MTGDTGTCAPADATGDPATIPLAGACLAGDRWGGFTLAVSGRTTWLAGTLTGGSVPGTTLVEVGAAGACTLLRRESAFCDPPCPAGEACDADGTCVPLPPALDPGEVTVDGVAPPGACAAGSLVELQLCGGDCGAVTLHGVCPEAPTLTGGDWVLEAGVDLSIGWSPPAGPVNPGQHVHVTVSVDQHGNTPVTMVCDLADTGAAVIPGSLVGELLSFGVRGFPNATVERRTLDSGSCGTGCVELAVVAASEPPGLVVP